MYSIKRTTIEINEDLLARAKRSLGLATTRVTVEESLRIAVAHADAELDRRTKDQIAFLQRLPSLVDIDILASDDMWR